MRNYVKEGHNLPFIAPSGGVTSGQGVLIGTHQFGISTKTLLVGEEGEMLVSGVVEIAKTSALAIVQGDALYWDNTNKVVNKTAAAQKQVGYAVNAAANPSATVLMRLTPNGMLYP